MKVYLLNPPFIPNFVRCGRWQGVAARGGTLYYPIWLAYATGILEKDGHDVKLVDAIASKMDENQVIEDVINFKPDIIIVDSNFSSLNNDISVANSLKKHTGAISILVGPPVAQYKDDIVRKGIDIALRFEFDFVLKDLLKVINAGENLSKVKGISYLHNGEVIHTEDREFSDSHELDPLPFVSEVYKKHLKIEDYFLNHALYPMVQIFTTRGCPNQCTFCSWPENLMGRKYRSRSVENVVNEFEYIRENLPKVKEIFIEDDSFTINQNNVVSFCEELQKRNIRIAWSCQSRANLKYETMVAMKKAGCRLLDVGYESGNDQILKNIKKGIIIDQLREFTKNAKKAKLRILADFVIGFPGETKETANATLKFIHEIKPDLLQVAVATPIPGTEFYKFCKLNNFILSTDFIDSIDNRGFQKCIISYPGLRKDEIQNIVNQSLKDYYLNPSYIPLALKNVFNKNLLSECKLLLKSSKTFMLKN